MNVIAVHLQRCTGCKTCELYCATERGSNTKTLLTAVGEKPLPQSRMRIEGSNELAVALQCRQCQKAPCLDSCLSGALTRELESSTVVIQESKCIGCWTCTLFCPYGVIYPWPERRIALKCDRCLYMETPVCVDVCPTRALELVNMARYDEFLRKKRENTAMAMHAVNDREGAFVFEIVPVNDR